MKNKCLSILSLFVATSAIATDFTYTSPDNLWIVNIKPDGYPYSSVVLKLDEDGTVATGGSSVGYARFMTNGTAMRSLTTDSTNKTSNFKGFDLVGPWNVNLCTGASGTGEYTALNLDSDARLIVYSNTGIIKIYNYNGTVHGENTLALANFKTLTLSNGGTLQVDTNTRMTGNELILNAEASNLLVSRGTLDYQVQKTTWNKTGASLNVLEGATFKMNTANFSLNKASIAGEFINETTNKLSFVAKASAPAEITGTLFSKGRLRLENGANAIFAGDVSYYVTTDYDSVLLAGSATLSLNSKDTLHKLSLSTKEEYDSANEEGKKAFVVRTENDETVYYKKEIAKIVMATNNSNAINVNATNEFYLELSGEYAKNATVNIASDATWIVNGFISVGGTTLNLNNFENDSLFILTGAKDKFDSLITTINAIAADGTTTYGKDDLVYVADIFNGQNGYWLQVAVPEPAEWAMIFGGLALGLAIYRRRK